VLGSQVRLKKMPSGCWLVDGLANGERVHPLEAFVLALCTGEHSREDLDYLVGHTLDKDPDWSERLVDLTLGRLADHVEIRPERGPRNLRYRAASFLYPVSHTERTAEGRLDSPGELTLVLTHQCNFRCIYCFNDAEPGKAHAMSTGDWLRVLAQSAEQGVVRCTISGGEPMTHPGFREILDAVMAHDMVPYVCTNGSLIEAADVRYFAAIGLPYLQISLDAADEATHDRMSQAPGSLPRVRRAIRSLVEAGVDVVVKSVITPLNAAGLGELIDSCHDWGVSRITLDRFDLSNAGRGNERLFLTPAMERWMGETARGRQERFAADGFVVTAVDTPRCWSGQDDIIVCGALSTGMTILPDGQVSICEKVIDYPDLTVGDLRQQSVAEVWNSPRAGNVLRPFPEQIDPICRDCPQLPGCHTGCLAQTLIVTDDPYRPDPRCWNARYPDNPYVQYAAQPAAPGASHG
jgi:pyrroloquinoline quinone biosynthesis protein E